LAITSINNQTKKRKYRNTQFRYAFVYVLITSVVLIFLNLYCSGTSQRLFYQSKESSMVEKCLLASADLAALEEINAANVFANVSEMEGLRVSRLLVTDHRGMVLYDSLSTESALGNFVLLPEVVQAMEGETGQDVFYWEYRNGVMLSRVATPIVSHGNIVGCVYMMEYDAQQGGVILRLQQNIFAITAVLEVVVILFSFFFATGFSQRLRRVLSSMRIISRGDYSHRVKMGGNDELTLLGDEFNHLTERLQDSESQRAQFVSDASHELKTPLASIKLLTDSILQNDMDQETVREFVANIGSEADRLTRMTQKLLTLSHSDSQAGGIWEIEYMQPTVDRVVKMLSGTAAQKNVRFDLYYKDNCPVLIFEDDLYQIIFNLVENAIKYNRPDGTLFISTFRDGDNAILEVRDTGIGIPKDSLEHIFERFYRVDKARSRSTGGSGLGLSIVRSMVERNHGTITAKSIPDRGSVFTVTFPIFDEVEELP
jgi:signal transduction histidine kinase